MNSPPIALTPTEGPPAGLSTLIFSLLIFLLNSLPGLHVPKPELESYDYVIVGGGLCGSVIASRLSEDASTSVLLLEAGGQGNVLTRTPSAWITLPGTQVDWGYRSVPQKYAGRALVNRQVPLTAGKVLGGGSMVNVVLWVRGIAADFDDWPRGWSFQENLPYYVRVEDTRIPKYRDSRRRGVGGPITVTEGNFQTIVGDFVMQAAAGMGFRTNFDYNDVDRIGFSRPQSDVSWFLRVDSDRAYLQPILDSRDNLVVLTFAHASRVTFDGHRATGVEFYHNNNDKRSVRAKKEVIITAGAIGSAKLLLLSGVGPHKHLRRLGIPMIADLPVGNHLMDHYGTNGLIWKINQTLIETMGSALLPNDTRIIVSAGPAALVDWTGFIDTNQTQALSLETRSRDTQPDVQLLALAGLTMLSDFGFHLKHVFNIRDDVWRDTFEGYYSDAFMSASVSPLLLHPKSTGSVRLASADPFDQPRINTNYFKHPQDMQAMVRGMKFAVKLYESPIMRRKLGARLITPPIPGCAYPPDAHSDGYLECLARSFTQSICHYSGTTRMGRVGEADAVVAPDLRIIGLERVRVADTSVFPSLPSGNTQATAYMLAEKAADLIKAGAGSA